MQAKTISLNARLRTLNFCRCDLLVFNNHVYKSDYVLEPSLDPRENSCKLQYTAVSDRPLQTRSHYSFAMYSCTVFFHLSTVVTCVSFKKQNTSVPYQGIQSNVTLEESP